jgi:hypothetical protein
VSSEADAAGGGGAGDGGGGGEPQVSWKAIEPDAQVFSTEGEAVAKASKVVGDADADVFTGLAISLRPLSRLRFVPSERVRAIWPDRVELDLTKEEVEALPEHEEQTALQIVPGDSWVTRARRWFRG